MTMTDTEAKALALVNEVAVERGGAPVDFYALQDDIIAIALYRAIERETDTEARRQTDKDRYEKRTAVLLERDSRRTAELREQAERFSEAAANVKALMVKGEFAEAFDLLAPFILPKPDPLVEVIADVRPWDTNHQWNNAAFSKRLAAAIEARGGKIVWEAGE